MNDIENPLIRKRSSLANEELKEVRSRYHVNILRATYHELTRFAHELGPSGGPWTTTAAAEAPFPLDVCHRCTQRTLTILSKLTRFVDELCHPDVAEVMTKYLRGCLQLAYVLEDVHEIADFAQHTLRFARPPDQLVALSECYAFLEERLGSIDRRLEAVEEFAQRVDRWKANAIRDLEVSLLMIEEDVRMAKASSAECVDRVRCTYDALARRVAHPRWTCCYCLSVGTQTRKLEKQLQHVYKKRQILTNRSGTLRDNLREMYHNFKSLEIER